jgi:amidase
MRGFIVALAATLATPAVAADAVEDKSLTEISAEIASGKLSSEAVVKAYLARIAAIDDAGPQLNAVLSIMPDALAQARARDAEQKAGVTRGPLHGVPILIKDNIEAAGPIATTAGSLALVDNVTNRDAPLVERLKREGAIILGKTNLSEWANIRSSKSTSGWSAVGGLTRNPHVLNRNTCGSSSGSGAAMAASLAAGTIGTETDGSIVCPAGINGVVGFKPTLGLVSRTYIVPISSSQDTAGPITRTVADAALLLSAIAGSDPADPATADADKHVTDFVKALDANGLKGARIGVLRDRIGTNPDIVQQFDAALATLRKAGADVVEIKDSKTGLEALDEAEFTVLLFELKATMARYLASTPKAVKTRTLADVIAFNKANAATELRWFNQDTFELAESKGKLDDPAYVSALERSKRLAGAEGLDRLMRDNKVELLVLVNNGPSWVADLVNGDNFTGPSASQLPAIAGYPHITVPMGDVKGLPIGLSIIGGKWQDARVLGAGYGFEQLTKARIKPRYLPSLEAPARPVSGGTLPKPKARRSRS